MTLKVIKLVRHGTTLLNGGGHDVFYTIFEGSKTIMEINHGSPDFFSCLMEKYHNKIVVPYKSGEELLDTLKGLYCFEPIDYEEAMIEMKGFVVGKNITKERRR